MLSSSAVPQIMLSRSDVPQTTFWPLKNPIRLVPHTMSLPHAALVPHTTSVPQIMLSRSDVPQMMLSTAVPQMMLSSASDVPQMMLSPLSEVPQMMLSWSPVPHTTFCPQACWFTSITAVPETRFVPQMMFCAEGTFSVPNVVCGSIADAIHFDPIGCDVSA